MPVLFLLTSFQQEQAVSGGAFRILLISDLNAGYGSTSYSAEVLTTLDKIPAIKPDMVLCGGDMVAGQKRDLTETQLGDMWNAFNNEVFSKIKAHKLPFGFTLGNHDASPSFTLDRQYAEAFWQQHKAETNLKFVEDSHYPYYYSFEKNGVFFISWDASAAHIKEEVYTWMEAQLKTRKAQQAKLRILLGHLPLYAIVEAKNKKGEVNDDPEKAFNFFKQHHIDLYISGHQHAYYPAEKSGLKFLNLGCIGNGPRSLLGDTAAARKTYTVLDIPKGRSADFKMHTYDALTQELVHTESLPISIQGFNGVSTRSDF